MPDATDTVAYTGWMRRPGQTWQPAVTASTEDEAWRLLRQHVEQSGAKLIDTYVGASDIDPRGRRRPGPMQLEMFR